MSVIGFDDSRLARLSHVALTTVAQDTQQITTLAVTRAIDRLDGTRRSPTGNWSSRPTSSSAAPPHHRPDPSPS